MVLMNCRIPQNSAILRDLRLPSRCEVFAFTGILRHRLIVRYRRLGTTYRPNFQGSSSQRSFPYISSLSIFYTFLLPLLFFIFPVRPPVLHLAVASCSASAFPQSTPWHLNLLPTFPLLHAALILLVSITFPENQSPPKPFSVQFRTACFQHSSWTVLTLENGIDRLSRNVGNYQSNLCDFPEKRISRRIFYLSSNHHLLRSCNVKLLPLLLFEVMASGRGTPAGCYFRLFKAGSFLLCFR
jgi:hypothetical protein